MKIKEKLRSSKGASLIIALVFMLFCAMIGSAVLAAATANGGRIAALKSDQQEYLDQRSAATLLADELQINDPKLVITETTTVTTTYRILDGGGLQKESTADPVREVKFEVKTKSGVTTKLQQVLFESAILQYMSCNDIDKFSEDIISGFTDKDGSELKAPEKFMLYNKSSGNAQSASATLSVSLSEGTVGSAEKLGDDITAMVGCAADASQANRENKVAPYTFNVGFGTFENGAFTDNSQLYLRMYATTSRPREVTFTETGLEGNDANHSISIETTTKTTTIRWNPAEILKGAAVWNT